MVREDDIQQIEHLVDDMLAAYPLFFRINVKVKPANNLKVYIDGDEGISIEQCTKFNRRLYSLIEDSGIFNAGEFSLEVSSPGVGQPLKLHRQYVKNIGRNVEIIFIDGTNQQGKLIQVTETDIILEQATGKGKKLTTQQLVIPFSDIKNTIVQIKF